MVGNERFPIAAMLRPYKTIARSHPFSSRKAIWTTSRVYKKKTRASGFPYSKMKLLTECQAIASDQCYTICSRGTSQRVS
ncbi:MAG: hypothetical protein EBE86_003560 [Hormoscilla sp. GUM202]|nr:hypothetical protein [Hormoscilla sp. GM7CHS1pb]MBO1346522.1 hypothetical protein [Hormoscilla sp. GUM202]